ncbi:helix-turn-helix domain-containing protein [Pedobacter lithocola]|uniref:Helix-turn-helix domain-containing protein n=1 Tax=Pedobacter lithocola TaxID=1908239 RepID=A0ABV8PAS0_9SPHI
MIPSFFPPHPALQHTVSHIMVAEVKNEIESFSFSPFPPTPQHAIHFYPRDPVVSRDHVGLLHKLPSSVIIGPQVSQVNIAMGMEHLIVSVAFMPGGMHRLLGMPMYELYDQAFDATLVLGSAIAEVNEQLQEVQTPLEMKTIVENFLLKKLSYAPVLPWEHAMREQLQRRLSIENAASVACLSIRQFERRSKEIMGYSPKMFSRLVRFSQAYRLKEQNPGLSWTSIAYSSGYYDQMHMIRDFKAFTDGLPRDLTKQILLAPALLQEHLRI